MTEDFDHFLDFEAMVLRHPLPEYLNNKRSL